MFRFCWALLFFFSVAHASPAPEVASGWSAKAPVRGHHYMAVTANPLASEAAAEILERGGSAMDAAIAAQMVLNVVEPQSSGIGGGGFLLYYDAKTGRTQAFDGRERAPKAVTPSLFLNEDGTPMEFHGARLGGRSVGVPGLLRMLEYAHDLHGTLPWDSLFYEAILLADNGFPVSPRLEAQLRNAANHSTDAAFRQLYFRDGEPLKAGQELKNPALARTLRTIAAERSGSFYEGKLADKMVKAVRGNALSRGLLTHNDLIDYMPEESAPVCMHYRAYNICSVGPPSSGGVALLQALGMLEQFPLPEMRPFSAKALHLALEAVRLAYADRATYLADPDFVDVPTDKLLDGNYLMARARMITGDKALPAPQPGNMPKRAPWRFWSHYTLDTERPSTTHISIVDKHGNVASMTTSIEHGFGSGVMVEGFLLNNQLTDFAFMPKHDGKPVANRAEGGKKPRSTMTPVIVFDEKGKPLLVVGSPGGPRIVPYVLKVVLGVLDWNIPLQQALNTPNFAAMGERVELEGGTPPATVKGLAECGQEPQTATLNSGVHAILFTPEGLVGAADPRREGAAVGK